MDSAFKISKASLCNITVTGLEQDSSYYLDEDSTLVSTRCYKYTQSATVNIATSIDSEEEETIQGYDITLHKTDCIDESTMELPIDGLYKITHIILPTKEWLTDAVEKLAGDSQTLSDFYELVYVVDSSDGKIYKYSDETYTEVEVAELAEVNPLVPEEATDLTTTIIRGDKNTFTICHLMDCFYRLCNSLLSTLPDKCDKNKSEVEALIKNRDIIWMAINVIKYLLELQSYYEALRILERVTQCGSICSNATVKKTVGGGCGCNNKS